MVNFTPKGGIRCYHAFPLMRVLHDDDRVSYKFVV